MVVWLFGARFVRGLVSSGALVITMAGCAESASGDMAMVEIQRLRAEARANQARLEAIEGRQMYVAQQLSFLAGVIGAMGRESAERVEALARKQDEGAARIERVEVQRATIAELERERVAAETPQAIASRAQALIDAGQVKATVRNGRTKLEATGGGTPLPQAPPRTPELEDPWAAQRKPPPPAPPPPAAAKPARRMSDDLGF